MADGLNGVMFQFFHWFLPPGGTPLWRQLRDEADNLRACGIDAVWIPPPQKCASGGFSAGYDVFDHFDLGAYDQRGTVATKYGTKEQLHDAINALHGVVMSDNGQLTQVPGARYIDVYVDVVLNQKFGGAIDPDAWQAIRVDPNNRTNELWGTGFERGPVDIRGYTWFRYPAREGHESQFEWRARHFDSVDRADSIAQNGVTFKDPDGKFIYRFLYNEAGYDPPDKAFGAWVSLEKGNYEFLAGADIDFGRPDVRQELKDWGAWLVRTIGADGLRMDAVKHYPASYAREWIGHVRAAVGRPLFAVGEYIAGDTGPLHGYLGQVTAAGAYPQDITLFDFPLRFKLKEASRAGDRFDLGELNRGTLMTEQPTRAVTFVENHDYQFGRDFDSHVREWFKPIGYAFILLRAAGYPCVFHGDYYGIDRALDGRGQPAGKEYLDLLLKVRKQFALGEERYVDGRNVAGWVRLGGVPGARGALAVVIYTAAGGVGAVNLDTGRTNRRFYHLATIKHDAADGAERFIVARGAYDRYGDKSDALWTGADGRADFVADAGTVSLWLEDGVGLV